MISKPGLLYNLFQVVRDSPKPLSQKEIIDKLLSKGYKKTTCVNLFTPCILQPMELKDKDGKRFAYPIIEKHVEEFSELRSVFIINPRWKEVNDKDAKDRLHFNGY